MHLTVTLLHFILDGEIGLSQVIKQEKPNAVQEDIFIMPDEVLNIKLGKTYTLT